MKLNVETRKSDTRNRPSDEWELFKSVVGSRILLRSLFFVMFSFYTRKWRSDKINRQYDGLIEAVYWCWSISPSVSVYARRGNMIMQIR